MPDISLFTDLCNILKITLNDLFAGEKIKEESFDMSDVREDGYSMNNQAPML